MDLQHEADRLLEGSMALNTLNSYRNGLASYEKFLSIQGLENKRISAMTRLYLEVCVFIISTKARLSM
jgi:site-specific recombinase XerD